MRTPYSIEIIYWIFFSENVDALKSKFKQVVFSVIKLFTNDDMMGLRVVVAKAI